MKFKIGDKIRVIDDDLKGTVIRIHKNRVTILNEHDFEDTYNSGELILDERFSVGNVEIFEEEPIKKKEEKSDNRETAKEVDLHIGQLLDSYKNLSNFEMLQIQLQKVKDEMTLAKAERRTKLIFVHGHGTGKLKSELMKLLKTYKKIEIYDASFRKYNGGATEVRLR